jgi:voltage-gated potassium channel
MYHIGPRHVLTALLLCAFVVLVGGFWLWVIGEGDNSFGQALYFALITVATVGYSELPGLSDHPWGRTVNAGLVICGVVVFAFFQSTLTALLIQGLIGKAYRKHRMERSIAKLSGHVVLAGCGRTGRYIVEELSAVTHPFVVIDRDPEVLEAAAREMPSLLFVHGDATLDQTLREAGVERAAGFIAALSDDRDNLFATLSAHALNPSARIVTKVRDAENESKMQRAGASATVSPHRIGGLRLVAEVVRPQVTQFLDQMLRVTEKSLRFEEVEVPVGSPFSGKSLREVPIRAETNLLVVAVHEGDGSYTYNPAPDHRLSDGTRLIVIGETDGVRRLRRLVLPD